MKTGIELIAEERYRQMSEEGFDARRDDQYTNGQLPLAASCYARHASGQPHYRMTAHYCAPILWPWPDEWWKPSSGSSPESRIRDLQKAGALIAAEIDRLQRLSA